VIKLSQDPIAVVARLGVEGRLLRPGRRRDDVGTQQKQDISSPRVRLDAESLMLSSNDGSASSATSGNTFVRNETMFVPSSIVCLNTSEAFKQMNKNEFLDGAALSGILRACGLHVQVDTACTDTGTCESDGTYNDDGETDEDLSALLTTVCLSHLDLKKHVYLYWFAFPALLPRSGRAVRYASTGASKRPAQMPLTKEWGKDSVKELNRGYRRLRVESMRSYEGNNCTNKPGGCPPFFVIVRDTSTCDESSGSSSIRCLSLSKSTYDKLSKEEKKRVTFGFLDPIGATAVNADEYASVGWSLRNLIAYLTLRLGLGGCDVDVVSYRPALLQRLSSSDVELSENPSSDAIDEQEDGSLLLRIALPSKADYDWLLGGSSPDSTTAASPRQPLYRTTGYEPNVRGRPGPRTVNLSPLLSPQHLSAQASDLNLRLMKWRAVPDLNLDRLGSLRVLLLGAGTLGCSVARTLQGWGVRDMTLVDNGRVSYSNPVRQNLFELTDCAEGGKMKAAAAAESLRRIAGEENMKSRGVALTIPMPGHPFGTDKAEEVARNDTAILSDLIKECDVVFLLTDTRESRWLPTVMARAEGKMLINAALGLDSWLVMRHGGDRAGGSGSGGTAANDSCRLGCYFCNDVVAPENSTNNRTLDQQCTVTRPGLAPIASSMAVELMVSLLHHPLGHAAPAPRSIGSGEGARRYRPTVSEDDADNTETTVSPLGLMPHQIRGSIVSYTMMTPTVPAFAHCTGCSNAIVQSYKSRGFEFVKEVCNSLDGAHLENVSGLTESRRQAEKMMEEAMEDWGDDDF